MLPVLHDALPKYKAAHPSASHQSAMAGVGAQWRQLQQAAGPGAGGASAAAEERTDSSPERETDGGGEVPGDAAESSADSSDDGSDSESDSESVELTQAG